MKILMILAAGLLFTFTSNAQIEIEKHDIKTECNINDLKDLEPLRATSDCGEVTVTYKDLMFSGGCLGTLSRSYTFTDECGNKAQAEQYFSLKDTEAPTLHNVPEDTSAVKGKLPKPADVTATDNASDDEIKVSFEESEEKKTVIRRWKAKDNCGNETIMEQVIRLTKP